MPYDYDYERFLERVRAAVKERYGDIKGRRHKFLYEDARLDLDKSEWSRKWKGPAQAKREGKTGTEFTPAELAILAEMLGAPYGWPYIDWQYALSLKEAAEAARDAARKTTTSAAPGSTDPEAASPSGRPGKRTSGNR